MDSVIIKDQVSGVSFEAFTPWLASLQFIDVGPFVATSNPKHDVFPSVTVTWGRRVDCPGGPACGVGARYQYHLRLLPDGTLSGRFSATQGAEAWLGTCNDDCHPSADCPGWIKRMAMDALRLERSREFDGCRYRNADEQGWR